MYVTDAPQTTDLPMRLRSIADASRKLDGTDIPLGNDLRAAADEIERLCNEVEDYRLAAAGERSIVNRMMQEKRNART